MEPYPRVLSSNGTTSSTSRGSRSHAHCLAARSGEWPTAEHGRLVWVIQHDAEQRLRLLAQVFDVCCRVLCRGMRVRWTSSVWTWSTARRHVRGRCAAEADHQCRGVAPAPQATAFVLSVPRAHRLAPSHLTSTRHANSSGNAAPRRSRDGVVVEAYRLARRRETP